MSKKLALGAGALILDVKWGSGAFRKTVPEARELAVALRQVARDTGVRCEALITDMNQPLGPALGTACEVREAIAILSGSGDRLLRETSLALSREAMKLRGWDGADAAGVLARALDDGSALAAWERMVAAHGGNPDPDVLEQPQRTLEVTAVAEGTVAGCDGEELGRVAAEVGAGRRRVDEELAHGAGIVVHARIGDRVDVGEPLATLLIGRREVDEERQADRIRGAFTIGDGPVDVPPLILGTVEDLAE
jgi:thymidine phosphorylase